MRNSVGTAVVPLKAPRGGFRGGPRGSDMGSVPAGLRASVTDYSFGDRISHLLDDHDLFTYRSVIILRSFTFMWTYTGVIIADF